MGLLIVITVFKKVREISSLLLISNSCSNTLRYYIYKLPTTFHMRKSYYDKQRKGLLKDILGDLFLLIDFVI